MKMRNVFRKDVDLPNFPDKKYQIILVNTVTGLHAMSDILAWDDKDALARASNERRTFTRPRQWEVKEVNAYEKSVT